MKRVILLFCLAFSFTLSNAQRSLLFKEKYIPNEIYLTKESTTTNLDITFTGDTDAVAKIKARGLTSPTLMMITTEKKTVVTSDSIKGDGSLPMKFGCYAKSKSVLNNVIIPEKPNPMNNEDVIVNYNTANDKINVISINGDSPYDKKTALENLLNSQRIRFPDTLLKVGDTFSRKVPFNYPTQGMDENIILINSYTLTAIKGDKAYFDIKQEFNAGLDVKNIANAVSIKGEGEGTGKIIFSITNNCIVSNIYKLNYTLNANKKGIAMIMKYAIASTLNTEVMTKESESGPPPTVKELAH